jgi:hypothetical protein
VTSHDDKTPRSLWVGLGVFVVLLVLILSGVFTQDGDKPGPEKPAPVATAPVSTDSDAVEDTTMHVPQSALDEAAKSTETNLRGDEDSGPVGPASLPKELGPLEASGIAGCRVRLIQTNYSSRGGVRPSIFVLHYTVSRNSPGFADVDGITVFFSRSSTQASSHFVNDADGNCNVIVPLSAKAWTQGNMNPVSISVEQIAMGDEDVYAKANGMLRLAKIIYYVHKHYGIPIRAGNTVGCGVQRSGIVDHDELACGNDHFDIGKFSVSSVIKVARKYAASQECPKSCREKKARERKIKRFRDAHAEVHKEFSHRKCAKGAPGRKPKQTKACKALRQRNAYLHKQAKKQGFSLRQMQ